ncbi:MAG: UbiX family flavin prenyltransferase [Saprospiraceae bacterium]|nr:UbiX family flavin prenyltransferase [Saprospiraceae bacterium]
MRKIVVAISGSSGSVYAKVLLDKLNGIRHQLDAVGIVWSDNARINWELEIGPADLSQYPFSFFEKNDFNAPFASGSARYDTMIVCPCSMGTLARITTGISNDLLTRAADVILKERRRLILVTRDTPLSLIHINNMKTVTEAGGIICPACPSFYSKPEGLEAVAATVVDRVLDLAGLEIGTYRWGEHTPETDSL